MQHELRSVAGNQETAAGGGIVVDFPGQVGSVQRSHQVGDHAGQTEIQSLLGDFVEGEGLLDGFLDENNLACCRPTPFVLISIRTTSLLILAIMSTSSSGGCCSSCAAVNIQCTWHHTGREMSCLLGHCRVVAHQSGGDGPADGQGKIRSRGQAGGLAGGRGQLGLEDASGDGRADSRSIGARRSPEGRAGSGGAKEHGR